MVKHNSIKFIKFIDGTGYELASYNNDGKLDLQTNKDYRLKVITEGDNIKVYLDNKLVINTKDQTHKEGYFGLNVWNSTTVFNEVKAKINKK